MKRVNACRVVVLHSSCLTLVMKILVCEMSCGRWKDDPCVPCGKCIVGDWCMLEVSVVAVVVFACCSSRRNSGGSTWSRGTRDYVRPRFCRSSAAPPFCLSTTHNRHRSTETGQSVTLFFLFDFSFSYLIYFYITSNCSIKTHKRKWKEYPIIT